MALSFVELYLTTANSQFSQDRTEAAISLLLSLMEKNQDVLDKLYKNKQSGNEQKYEEIYSKISDTRKKLGLPIKNHSIDAIPPKTYNQTLSHLLKQVVVETGLKWEKLVEFKDPQLSPDDIILKLKERKKEVEKKSTAVWGIETPRLFELEYGGFKYLFPYRFLSIVLVLLVAPLTAVWMGSFYMTRQRELHEINKATDFQLIFPHILNFIPVNLSYIEINSMSAKEAEAAEKINWFSLSLMRTFVVLGFITPILYAHSNALYQLFYLNQDQGWLIWLCLLITIYIYLQSIGIIIQEWVVLKRKLFIGHSNEKNI